MGARRSSSAPSAPAPPGGDLDAFAASYEDEIRRSISFAGQEHEFYVKAKAQRLIGLGERHLGDLGEAEALDVGCGIGLIDRFLVDRIPRLHGTDISPEMIARAEETNPRVRYEQCEPHRLPYPDEQFDLVFAFCVLHHIEVADRPDFVRELQRVTRPGGLLVLLEHNPWNPLTRLAVRWCRFDEDVRLLPRREVRRLAAGAELDVVEAAYLFFTPWGGRFFARLDRSLAPLPFGAQYFIAAQRAPWTHRS
jgi:SAM-dependent methyltransferase